MSGKSLIRTALAVLLGAAIAFPAGLMLGGNNPADSTVKTGRAQQAARWQPYSPKILNDPYFLDQQRRNVEALEAACRQSGHSCPEARQARRWLEKLLAKE